MSFYDKAKKRKDLGFNQARENLIELFMDCLKQGNIPWKQGFVSTRTSYNPITNVTYKGVNRFILYMNEYINDYQDPRWMTFNQARKHGYSVKQGAKGVKIEYWSWYDKKTKETITASEAKQIVEQEPSRKDDLRCVSRTYTVFNGAQINGLEPYSIKKIEFNNKEYSIPLAVMNTFSANTFLLIVEDKTLNIPHYNINEDIVKVPSRNRYTSEQAFFCDVFHEIAHATSNVKRLDRKIVPQFVSLEKYALEELRAEIASAFICGQMGIEYENTKDNSYIDNSVAYVQHWLKELEQKPIMLFRAINDAEKISDYIAEKGELSARQRFYEKALNGNCNTIGVDEFITETKAFGIAQISIEELNKYIQYNQYEYNGVCFAVDKNEIVCLNNRTGNHFVEVFDINDGLSAFVWLMEIEENAKSEELASAPQEINNSNFELEDDWDMEM